MAKPIAMEKCVASRQWAGKCLLQVDTRVQLGAVYGLSVVMCSSKHWWQVMLSSELAWVVQKGYSACHRVSGFLLWALMRQRVFATKAAASAFTSHPLSLLSCSDLSSIFLSIPRLHF
jgi:hypothetical protein